METPPEGFFVARDRARGIGWSLEKLLQERRLAWQGDAIGMASVADDADRKLADLAAQARTSVEAVLAGRIRDRERGFMEIPFAVALTSVGIWLEEAAAAEVDRRVGRGPEPEARTRAEGAMTHALDRLEAFQAAYDAKTPVAEARVTDVARLLRAVDPEGDPPWDRPPPPLRTEPHALTDLLLVVREALPAEARGAWQVLPPAPGQPLRVRLGSFDGRPGLVAVPPSVARAAEVLAFRHPAEVEAWGVENPEGESDLRGLALRLGVDPGAGLEATLEVLAGPDACLAPEAEEAARRLLAAPALPPGSDPGAVPPERLVALVGLVRVLEGQVRGAIGPRLGTGLVRMAAGGLPRERTRKAPPRRALLDALGNRYPHLSVDRLGTLAQNVARGRRVERDLGLAEAALLLSVLGLTSTLAGVKLERSLDMAPLDDAEVEALLRDLLDVEAGRKALAEQGVVAPGVVATLESAALGALGRLGRLERS